MLFIGVFVVTVSLASSDGNMCYECNRLSHPNDCNVVTQCGPHERCYVEQVGTSSGIILYNTGCKSSDICKLPGKKRSSHTICLDCCTSDYCNKEQCTNHHITEHGTRCLECNNVANPTDCNTVTLCNIDKSCNVNGVFGRSLSKRTLQFCDICCAKENCNRAVCTTTGSSNRDCQDLLAGGVTRDGVYTIHPAGSTGFQVYCDMTTDGGGWTVIQRRFDGSQDFYLNFANYTNGFGSVSAEYWLGNQRIHELTSSASYQLRIDMTDFNNTAKYAKYRHFMVGNASTQFTLAVSGFSGNAGNSFSYHNGEKFHTFDKDKNNCAKTFKGAWWYKTCYHSSLNGLYLNGSYNSHADGIEWDTWHGPHHSLKSTEMKIRKM